jgi:hypothetical protein
MSGEKFENVAILKKANVYFDGKVTAVTCYSPMARAKRSALCSPVITNSAQVRAK